MRYLISWNGNRIAVGLLEPENAIEEFNFAHNTFGTITKESLFYGVMGFKSVKQFWKFLILKEYLTMLMDNVGANKKEKKSMLKECFAKARKVRDNEVGYENFTVTVSQENNSYYSTGQYQDEHEWHQYS